MNSVMSTIVNFRGRFVNFMSSLIVDNLQWLVNLVNLNVNYANYVKLTPKCNVFKSVNHLSTLSTIKMLKVYMNKKSSIYVHNSRPTRARVRIPHIRVFKKTS